MRVLMISELYPRPNVGGLAKHALNLANYYTRQGHYVDFMGNEEHLSALTDEVDALSGVYIPNKRLNVRSIWRRLERRTKIYSYRARVSATKAIASEIVSVADEYDAIHYHGHYALLPLYVPAEMNLIVTHHDFNLICPKQIFYQKNGEVCNPDVNTINCSSCAMDGNGKLLSLINKANIDNIRREASKALDCHKHIFVSNRNLELTLLTLGKSRGTEYVVHNFIDCKRIINLVKGSATGRTVKKRIVLVNYLDQHKGISEFIEKFVKNINENDGFELLVGGDGPERGILERRYSQEWIKILGPLKYSDAINLMNTADICVVPSLWEESCSTAILEGMFLGKNILALARGGTPELKAYEYFQDQLMVFRNMNELVSSLKSYEKPQANPCNQEEFKCCVDTKAEDILKIYQY